MGIVPLLLLFAIGLAIAAYKAEDKFVRIFCVVCCLANIAVAMHAIHNNHPHAFKPYPNNGDDDPNYRGRR